MAEKSGFFNAMLMIDQNGLPMVHEDGSYRYDREYGGADFAGLFEMLLSDGVRSGGTNLRVSASGDGLGIMAEPGDAMIRGYYYKLEDENRFFTLNLPPVPYRRTDRLVLRLDLRQSEGRKIYLCVKEGIPAASPSAPELERNNEIYELGIADITINSTTQTITNGNIQDLRYDQNLCGLINSLITVDTGDILEQLESVREAMAKDRADFESWKKDTVKEFEHWYSRMQEGVLQKTYADFDNWIYRAGCDYVIEKDRDNIITETIKNSADERIIARREIRKTEEHCEERIYFYEPEIAVKRTLHKENEKIISTIEVIK